MTFTDVRHYDVVITHMGRRYRTKDSWSQIPFFVLGNSLPTKIRPYVFYVLFRLHKDVDVSLSLLHKITLVPVDFLKGCRF